MKTTKVFRARRGMRFSNGPRGKAPPAGFIGGFAITRTRPNASPVGDVDTVGFSGSVMRVTAGVGADHRTISGSISYGRRSTRLNADANMRGFNESRRASLTPGRQVSGGGDASYGFDPNIGYLSSGLADGNRPWDCVIAAREEGSAGNGISFRFSSVYDTAISVLDDLVNRVVNVKAAGSGGGTSTMGEIERHINASSSLVFVSKPSSFQDTILSSGFSPRTGSLIGGRDVGQATIASGVISPTVASVPSWTNWHLGSSRAYVITPLSSSRHETQILNYYRSGTELVESSPVPASAPLFYSKQNRLQTIVVKHTASFFDTVVPYSGVIVPVSFAPLTGALLTAVTGANMPAISCSLRYPATIRIPVPVQGRLVDIKVWVEIIHLSGGTGKVYPLGTLGLALRSPNVQWGHAHPVRNDPVFTRAFGAGAGSIVDIDPDAPPDLYYPPANFYRDTFLLWEGLGMCQDGQRGPGDSSDNAVDKFWPVWQRDRGMRTVFSDGAQIPNPRHLTELSPSGSNYNGAPNSYFGINSPFGMDVPWTSDRTIFPATESRQAAGSPPPGWLSGPANTAAVNEWPTTGVNYGAEQLKPLYPLLESIYQKKSIGNEVPLIGSIVKSPVIGLDLPQKPVEEWRGFRPGLRGTEVSGTWELLIALPGALHEWNRDSAFENRVYFRQARLEITYETGVAPATVRSSNRFSPNRPGPMLVNRISGSAPMIGDMGSGSWDGFVSENYVDVPQGAAIGRSYGLRLDDGSFNRTDYALVYRLSGSLADISGSAPGWLLNNPFGMPRIPESSASLTPPSMSESFVSRPSAAFFTPVKTLDGARRLADVAADFNPPKTLVQMASAFVSSSSR